MRIHTHYSPHHDPPWIAVDMDAAVAMLDGYDLNDDERNDIGSIMTGYCRLIDEAGLICEGQTEDEAIMEVVRRANESA